MTQSSVSDLVWLGEVWFGLVKEGLLWRTRFGLAGLTQLCWVWFGLVGIAFV